MSAAVSAAPPSLPSLRVAGKFFETTDGQPLWLNGVTYGPFPPNTAGGAYPDPSQLAADLDQIQALGFNCLRLYAPPSDTLLHAAEQRGLHLLVGLTWTDHVDFLSESALQDEILESVVNQATRLASHSCIAAFIVGNEIEKTLVRWMGPRRVQRFLEKLIAAVRNASPPGTLCAYATYPSTEYLMPRTADFFAVNLYLEDPAALSAYLQRLQNLAGNKPLVVTEFGLDVAMHGPAAQAETAAWQRHALLEAGVAGSLWFAFTDEWFRGGTLVTAWQFGLVTAHRQPRPVCTTLPTLPTRLSPLPHSPRFSVIICTRNGAATLPACLESLRHLRYPNYEVIAIDDGSTDGVPDILANFPEIRSIRQPAAGLSVARNRGMQEATGEILAYTDDDCLAHPDWLLHLSLAFAATPTIVAAGGPNIPPPPRNGMEAIVAAAPGAPAHVLLRDSEAEHLPGCNLAIRKSALQAIGGFQPAFTTAGDDVDVCWRLRDAGGVLHFAPAAMVWHHRRFTAAAYWRQQRGYGRAEALLMKHHPGRFGPLGGARWSGSIYGDRLPTFEPIEGHIFHGPLGEGLFQGIYTGQRSYLIEWLSGVLWIAIALLALALRLPGLALALTIGAGIAAWLRMRHLPPPPFPLTAREQLQLWCLCLLQPIAREWARLVAMIHLHARPGRRQARPQIPPPHPPRKGSLPLKELRFWSTTGLDRHALLKALQLELQESQIPMRWDDGWRRFDAELHARSELSSAVLTVTEYHGGKKCLTRVRPLLRFSRSILAAAAFLLLLEGLLTRQTAPFLATIGWVSLLATLPSLALLPFTAQRQLRKLIRKAARRAGLVEIE